MSENMPQLYKWLRPDGSCIWGEGSWPLPPEDGQPGKWLPEITDDLVLCAVGYHAFEAGDLVSLRPDGDACLVEVELRDAHRGQEKWIGRRGRVLRVVFASGARAEYERVRKPAQAECERVQQRAWAEYGRVLQRAQAEYERVEQPAWAEYGRVLQRAWAEYERVQQRARAEYERVTQQALMRH